MFFKCPVIGDDAYVGFMDNGTYQQVAVSRIKSVFPNATFSSDTWITLENGSTVNRVGHVRGLDKLSRGRILFACDSSYHETLLEINLSYKDIA